MTDTNTGCECPNPDADKADRFIKAVVASMGGPRQADWDGGKNPFARPNPNAPWVERWLPTWSYAQRVSFSVVHIGHVLTMHNFPTPDPGTGRVKRRPSLLGTDLRPPPENVEEPLVLGDVPPLDCLPRVPYRQWKTGDIA